MSKQRYEAIHSDLEGSGEWPAEGCQLHVCFGPEDDNSGDEVWEPDQRMASYCCFDMSALEGEPASGPAPASSTSRS